MLPEWAVCKAWCLQSMVYKSPFVINMRFNSQYTYTYMIQTETRNSDRLHTNFQVVTHEIPNGYIRISERLQTNFRVVTHEIPKGYTRIFEWLHMKFRFRQLHTNFQAVTHENPRGYTWISKKLHMKNQNIQFFGHILNTPYFWTPYANCNKVRPSAGIVKIFSGACPNSLSMKYPLKSKKTTCVKST